VLLRVRPHSVYIAALILAATTSIGCVSGNVSRRSTELRVATRVMPVRGIMPYDLSSNFGVPRDGGARSHEGLDIMAPEGREVLAITSGKIDSKKWNNLGGNTIWLQGDDGMIYYYAHLSAYRDGLSEGQRVNAGEVIGYVGKTGNASTPHLHFEVHQTKKSPAIDPYPLLIDGSALVLPMPFDTLKRTVVQPKKRK
jgi:peptidoglycan LD-endopeptidase LytH